jgi:hypothetical protein
MSYAYHIMYRAALFHQLQNKHPPDQEYPACTSIRSTSWTNTRALGRRNCEVVIRFQGHGDSDREESIEGHMVLTMYGHELGAFQG